MKDDPFNRPIRPIGEEDQDRLKTPGIEPIGETFEEHEEQHTELKKRVSPFAAFLQFFNKLLTTMRRDRIETVTSMKDDVLYTDLETVKLLFEQLSERDQSENINYAQSLSDAWISIGFHCEAIESGKMKSAIEPKKIRNFLKAVNTYPEASEHTLGYYLKHHAGKDWLPFPFMELLKKLHRGYAVDGEKSHLHRWIAEVSELISEKDIH